MNINGIGSSPQTGAVGGIAGPGNQLGQEQFLELLLVQMQNQSPLDPMDSQQFLAQLAQFSTLEQLAGVNAGIDNLALGQAAGVAGQIVTMIGKDVTYEGNELHLRNGEAKVHFELDQSAQSVLVKIRDANGALVRVEELGTRSSGENSWMWDGETDGGSALPPGTYTYEIEATTRDGETVRATTFSTGRVEGVTYFNGTPELIIGETRKEPADVIEIKEPEEQVER